MKRFLLVGSALVLAACGTFPWSSPIPADAYWLKAGAARPASRVESLLAYAEYVRGLSGAESAREHERLRQAVTAKDRSDFIRLQYAMLLFASAAPGRDLVRARQVLEPLTKEEGTDAELRRLAVHLHGAAGDLLDAERHFRDEQRRTAEEQRRTADLEQKLEALKSIERRIIQRTAPEPKR
jgi:hypothetical protein